MDPLTVAVLGASNKPERYSNQAVRLLKEHQYRVIPVHPALKEIEGLPAAAGLMDINEPVHTVTVYVSPKHIGAVIPDIIAIKPERVILNPGTESEQLEAELTEHGIRCIRACSLVLLRTGQFEEA